MEERDARPSIVLNDAQMRACADVFNELSNGNVGPELIKSLTYLCDDALSLDKAKESPFDKLVYTVALRVMKSKKLEETKRKILKELNEKFNNQ